MYERGKGASECSSVKITTLLPTMTNFLLLFVPLWRSVIQRFPPSMSYCSDIRNYACSTMFFLLCCDSITDDISDNNRQTHYDTGSGYERDDDDDTAGSHGRCEKRIIAGNRCQRQRPRLRRQRAAPQRPCELYDQRRVCAACQPLRDKASSKAVELPNFLR